MTTRGVGIAGRLGALLLPGVVATCGGDVMPEPTRPPDLDVLVAGCASIVDGPVCEVGDQPLTLWVDVDPSVELEVMVSGQPIDARSTEVDGGRRLVVAPGPDRLASSDGAGGVVELAVVTRRGDASARWSYALAPAVAVPALVSAERLRKSGRFDEARAALAGPLPQGVETRAASLRARIDLAQGRLDAALAGLRRGVVDNRRDGRISAAVADGFLLSSTLSGRRHDLAGARAALDDLVDELVDDAAGRARVGYYRAVIARDEGDLRTALRDLAEAESATARLDMAAVHRSVRILAGLLAEQLGQRDRAVEAFRALERDLPADASDCERADVATGRTWAELSRLGALDPRSGPPPSTARAVAAVPVVALAQRALEGYRTKCPRVTDVANARVNLALAALAAGDVDTASAQLRDARAETSANLEVAVWISEIDARLALARRDVRGALAAADELERRAGGGPEARWRARLLAGAAHEVAGDDEAALASYRKADELLRGLQAHVPINDGRASFLAQRDVGPRLLVDLLVRRGAVGEASAVARKNHAEALTGALRGARVGVLGAEARARFDGALERYLLERTALDDDAAGDWSVPADRAASRVESRERRERDARALLDDALAVLGDVPSAPVPRPAAPGELILVLQRTADGSAVHVFAQSDQGPVVHRRAAWRDDASPQDLAAALLEPIAGELERASRVHVVASGTLDELDIHALPWRGAPLADRIPVEYGVDLPPPARLSDRPPRALVVADTRDDLPGARAEGVALGARLSATTPTAVFVGQRARRAAVVAALGEATLFHFAGHGRQSARADWQSAVLLADSAELRAGDILALPQVPELVVLSGCKTARAAPELGADASLAHAFLAAGASVVIATTRPVSDRLGRAMSSALADELTASRWDLPSAFRRAIERVARSNFDADWQAYRLMTR